MSDDLYDFTGVTFDLELLKSELRSLQAATDKHMSNLTRPRNSHLNSVKFLEDDEEWYPPTPPVYDVTEKLLQVNKIFYDDPTSTIHEANRIRWRTGPALVQVKYLYLGESDDDCSKEEAESQFCSDCVKENKKNDNHTSFGVLNKRPVDSISDSPDSSGVSGLTLFTDSELKKSSINNPNLLLSNDLKFTAQQKKIKHNDVKEVNNKHNVSKTYSTEWKPLLESKPLSVKIPKSDTFLAKKKIDRHLSSDSILESSILPPVSRRRHSSQDRIPLTKAKTETTSPPQIGLIKPHLNNFSKEPKQFFEKPRVKSSCRISTAPIPISRVKHSKTFSSPVQTIVLEQVSLVNEGKPKLNLPNGRSNISAVAAPSSRLCPLRRNISYNSISSSSSVSSQAPEDSSLTSSSSSTDSTSLKRTFLRGPPLIITHPGITLDIGLASDGAVSQWKERKREEKRLCERRAFLQSQMRRLS